MAAPNYTPIQLYRTNTASTTAPAAGNLNAGELAINYHDSGMALYAKNSSGAVKKLINNPAGLTYPAADGSAYQAVQTDGSGTLSFAPSASSVLTAQGDLLYASGANTLARLAKSTTATRYLSNTGSNNNPAWAQIDLTNGVTGTLPIGSGGTGVSAAASNGQLLIGNGSGFTLANITVSPPLSISNTAGGIALTASGLGTGDVIGPTSATDNAVVRFDLTTGKIIQNSTATLSDAGVLALAGTANTLTIGGSATGSPTAISATGSDTNIEVKITGKGALGGVSLGTASGTALFAYTFGTAVNYFQAVGSSTGSSPLFYAAGSDTNVSMTFGTQGTGIFDFFTNSTDRQLRVAHTANAYNYVEITGGNSSDARAKISAQGSDTNVNIQYSSKNSGFHNFLTGGGEQFRIANLASAVNYLQARGNVTGSGPQLMVGGSDTDIDLLLTPKNAGKVSFGSYIGSVLSIAGYIEIKDSSGNLRKLAVVA
jgi:hypothetical protein